MVLPVGLGDQPKVAPLRLANPSDLCATLVPESHHSSDMARPALILEAEQALILSGMPQPALIKIDAEGFEAEILRGTGRHSQVGTTGRDLRSSVDG